ncbi:MAG: PD-(D/E)XK nuclease family protein [Phycicoccus sp.]
MSTVFVLHRPPAEVAERPVLDPSQAAAVADDAPVVRVLGAPGTGKSTVAVERVARVVAEGTPVDSCLLLAPTRMTAARLRDTLTARLGGTSTTPLARSHQSFAYGLLRAAAALRGDPAPRLLGGPEQDVVLRDLLAGHASGPAPGPAWPPSLALALPTRGFRAELRELLMRAVELGLAPPDLARLGERHDRPEWVAAAHVLREYDEVTALSAPGAHDPAGILGDAADLLHTDPDALGRLRGGLRLVVVDDAHELSPAARRLLDAVTGPGVVPMVLLGDPDSASQTFRGADPRLLVGAWPDAVTHVLDTGHRCSGPVSAAAARVVAHVGVVGGVGHRSPPPAPTDGAVEAHLLRTAAQEAALVSGLLREEHLLRAVPWSRMAVVVRGGARTAAVRRALQRSGVPVDTAAAEIAVRDEPAVRPLLALFRCALDLVAETATPDPETVVDVLLSPVGGADAVSLRRLRRALRRAELGDGGGRPSDALLVEAVLLPAVLDRVGPDATPARRVHRVLAAAVDALRAAGDVEQVLWAMWAASRLAGPWRDAALAGGVAGARADRDLDAVLGLFDAAARFADRLPAARPVDFLDHVLQQDVPGDTLVARAAPGRAVAVLTPAAAAGLEFDVVVVAGVQEGSWPDLRLRGSLLGSADLVDLVTGRDTDPRSARAQVRHDETRLFHVACTRARRRLVVTAVRSDDEQPSPYLDIVDPVAGPRPFTDVPRPLTLPGLVGELRRSVLDPDPAVGGAAVTTLTRLAREGVRGADPAQWWALGDVTDSRPRRAPDVVVRVSPSAVDAFWRCGLQWMLRTSGGEGPSLGAADVGILVHEIAHDLGDVDAAGYAAEVERRWGRLGMPPGWLSRRRLAEAQGMTARLATYVREAHDAGWRRAASEHALRVALGRAEVAGTVDRVEVDVQGRVRVVDLKTGTRKPTKGELRRHGQLGAYQVAVEHGGLSEFGSVAGGAALLHLGKAAGASTTLQEQVPLSDDAQPEWAHRLLADTADAMAGADFVATPGPHCGTCQVKDACPAQPEGRRG